MLSMYDTMILFAYIYAYHPKYKEKHHGGTTQEKYTAIHVYLAYNPQSYLLSLLLNLD